MPLTFEQNLARFDDICTVEDAMPLVEHLRAHQGAAIDLSRCTYLHSALLQLLLLALPEMAVAPTDPFLVRWIAPLFSKAHDLHGNDADAIASPIPEGERI